MSRDDTRWLVDGGATTLDCGDRGLAYGDGVFETMLVRGGAVWLLQRHLDRLADSCRKLGIDAPDKTVLEQDIATICADAPDPAVLKLIITRGSGGRGYRPPGDAAPRRMLGCFPHEPPPADWYERGIAVRWCATRLARQPALAGIKHLNRLEQVLACAEWNDSRWQEGLMQDTDGLVIEATRTNLFIVVDGELWTPSLRHAGVAGIMRGMLVDATTELGVQVQETDLTVDTVRDADELFLCNSVLGVLPVRSLGEQSYGAPGPVTARVLEWVRDVG